MKHEQREAARHFRCPRCGADLGMFDSFQEVARCPLCGWHRTGQHGIEAEPGKTPHARWVNSVGLLILGAVSPLVVLVGMSVAFVTGPLAVLLAPVCGIWSHGCFVALCMPRKGCVGFGTTSESDWPSGYLWSVGFAGEGIQSTTRIMDGVASPWDWV